LLPVWETLGAMKFKDILGEQLPKQVHITKEAWQALWENNKERELNQLYHAIQKDEIYTKVVAWILTIINQNLDTLLSGNISNVVEAELVKLQPREINDMVQDFMGKEMKSINILGAVLGALVGGVSAVAVFFMNLPKGFIWWMLGVYSGIFALVGIGTNWLAIKLLFRPYKALFKGARFPPFIGIVAARKPDFAKNFANFVKTRMLSKDAIQQQVVNNKEKIKKHIYDRVSESNYAVIDMLFEDESRLDSITHGVFLGIQTYITEHRTEIVETLAEKIKQLIAEGKLDEVIPEIQKLIVKKLRAGDVASLIHKMIQKEIAGKHLGTYHKVIERLSDMQLKRVLEHIINEASKNISVNSIKNLIYQYNKEFVSYIGSHAIVDLVGTTVITDFSQKINEPISRMLHDAIGPIVTHIEKQELNPDITLRNLFNGAIPKILDKNMGYMLDEICREIKKTKGTLITTIKGAMPFYTIPWKGQVEPIVTTLVDHELPDFLNRKRDYLWRIMETLLDNKLSQLGFNAQSLERETVERTIAGILDSPLVQEGVGKLLGIVITRLAQIPLSILLGFIQIRQIHDIIPPLEPLLATTISHVKNNISRTEVIDVIGEFIKTILLDSIKDIPIAGLLKDIELEKELRNVVSLLVQDQKVMTEIAGLVEDILFAVCRDPSFYDERTLQKDMVDFIVQLDQSHCWDALEPMVTPALKELFIKLNGVITNETKDQICDYLISAMIRGCVDNFDSIMGGIKVESVVERVIADMHPRSIETLFYKFAGAYFAKIILYGWIGFFGGILSYIISYGLGKFIK
jgi:uncharacterized membrane protein YheB (UPF0754 family)